MMKLFARIGAWFRRLFAEKAIVVPKPPDIPDSGVYITVTEAKDIIKATLGDRLISHSHIHMADAEYYCPSVEYVEHLLEQDLLDRMQYAAESFDCDDYAFVLKARFCLDAYKHGERRSAHCAGFVWGRLPHPHAMNWVITDDKVLRLIEPQNDLWQDWGEEFSIWLMAA